jgi:hypothetical protein
VPPEPPPLVSGVPEPPSLLLAGSGLAYLWLLAGMKFRRLESD